MAHGLLARLSMWLALGRRAPTPTPEAVLSDLAALLRFTADLQSRLAGAGVDGISGTLARARQLRRALAAVPAAEIERAQGCVRTLESRFAQLATILERLRRVQARGGQP